MIPPKSQFCSLARGFRTLRTASTLALLAASLVPCTLAQAQTTLVNEVHTVAASDQGVPVEYPFDVSATAAGTYQVTLKDLGKTQNPNLALTSVKLAITNGTTVVGTPLTAEGTSTPFQLAAGSYVVRVVGQPQMSGTPPAPVAGSGPFGVQITKTSDGSQLVGFSNTLTPPPATLPNNQGQLDTTFTVSSSATYQITLSDLKLPQNLQALTLLLTGADPTTPLATLTVAESATPPQSQASTSVALQPGVTYHLLAIGQSPTAVNAGLFSVVVRDPSNAAVFSRTIPVGAVRSLGTASLSAGTYNLNFADLQQPAALAQGGALIALDDQVAATLTTTGSKSFTATASTYNVFAVGTPGSTGAASYSVEVRPVSGAAALSVAQAIATTGSAYQAYSFNTDVSTTGNYTAQLTDFLYPQALTSITAVAVQSGAILGTPITATGSFNIAATSGKLWLLVFTKAASTGGLFGLSVAPGAGGSNVFEVTQGVGTLFATRNLTISAAGKYDVTLTDVAFPATFGQLAVVVTRGTTSLGTVFGSSAVTIDATAGNYFLNFVAQPSTTTTDKAGTYGMTVAATPAPTVTLTSDVSHVASGGTVSLTWSSQNTTGCTASGGWSGTRAVSGGPEKSAALTSNTTFTLTCTGNGGSANQSVTVTIDPPSSGGGGGGGALEWCSLLVMSGLAWARIRASRRFGTNNSANPR